MSRRKAGVSDERFSTGSAWGDYDRDGDLDLFIANYVDFRLDDLPQFGKGSSASTRRSRSVRTRGLPGAGDSLFRNNGDATFTDVPKGEEWRMLGTTALEPSGLI